MFRAVCRKGGDKHSGAAACLLLGRVLLYIGTGDTGSCLLGSQCLSVYLFIICLLLNYWVFFS